MVWLKWWCDLPKTKKNIVKTLLNLQLCFFHSFLKLDYLEVNHDFRGEGFSGLKSDYSKTVSFFLQFKGTVSVISSDLSWKDGNARFTKVCLIKYELDTNFFVSLNCLFLFAISLWKWLIHFLLMRSIGETYRNKRFSS